MILPIRTWVSSSCTSSSSKIPRSTVSLILRECGDHLVKVLLADALGVFPRFGSARPLISMWNWPVSFI